MINESSITRFYPSGDPESLGSISYVVSRSSLYPKFTHNSNVDTFYGFNPRQSYYNSINNYAFNTNIDDPPFIVIDLGPDFSIAPYSYSLSFMKGYTPPVSWSVSASKTGNDNEWKELSYEPENDDVCEEQDGEDQHCCGNTVYLERFINTTSNNVESYRYFKYLVSLSRIRREDVHYFRLMRFEIYGILFGQSFCFYSHHSFPLQKISCFYIMIFMP